MQSLNGLRGGLIQTGAFTLSPAVSHQPPSQADYQGPSVSAGAYITRQPRRVWSGQSIYRASQAEEDDWEVFGMTLSDGRRVRSALRYMYPIAAPRHGSLLEHAGSALTGQAAGAGRAAPACCTNACTMRSLTSQYLPIQHTKEETRSQHVLCWPNEAVRRGGSGGGRELCAFIWAERAALSVGPACTTLWLTPCVSGTTQRRCPPPPAPPPAARPRTS